MAKKALLDVLEQTIGRYVKNLDAESLNVALWKGKIELQSLQVDAAAVNAKLDHQAQTAPNLAMPFRLVDGEFRNFTVEVPWTSLMSKSVVLVAQGLHVTVEPYDRGSQLDLLSSRDVQTEEERAKLVERARQVALKAADEYRLRSNALRKLLQEEQDAGKHTAATASSSSTFGSRLVRRIIENLQIEIQDVRVSLKSDDCEAGVVLESLSLVTTDQDGQRTFVDRTAEKHDNTFLHKSLSIQGLGLYVDADDERKYRRRYGNTMTVAPMSPIREQTPPDDDQFSSANSILEHSYVLAPLSFNATLRQADGNVCVEHPKYKLSSDLKSLNISLSKTQLDLTRDIQTAMRPSSNAARPLFPEYRPATRVKGHARDWWKYAARCIGRLNGRRNWVEFFWAYQRRQEYIPLYKRCTHASTCRWLAAATDEEKQRLRALEQDRFISVEGIMAWRNMADAQVNRERLKHRAQQQSQPTAASARPRSYGLRSIFGSSTATPTVENGEEEQPPISLTMEELKELEAASMEQVADETQLSSDSKLAYAQFVMGSFQIHLTSYNMTNIAALEMGRVSTIIDVNADGSYQFRFQLASLDIHDRVTPRSLFPQVLRTLPQANNEDAFSVLLEKAKTGDQNLQVKLTAIETVASPLLLKAVRGFLSTTEAPKGSAENPLLRESLSGSYDLFYDASDGVSTTPEPEFPPRALAGGQQDETYNTSTAVSGISSALVDAWKFKTETKAMWVIHLDIQAPILLIPENCVDPSADVLIIDLGHLRLEYGKIEPSSKVTEWFGRSLTRDRVLDSGAMDASNLTFLLGKVDNWGGGTERATAGLKEKAVLKPVSTRIDFGVESRAAEAVPRVCAFGVIPIVSLRLSPLQISRVFKVLNSWKAVLKDVEPELLEPAITILEAVDSAVSSSELPETPTDESSTVEKALVPADDGSPKDVHPQFHFVLGFQMLSVEVVDDDGDGAEAHLVSVYASMTSFSDGSSLNRLRMGWFWILDRCQNTLPRTQRLVAHSNLPRDPEAFAADDRYDVVGELRRHGVFDEDYAGSSDLADITLKLFAERTGDSSDRNPFTAKNVLDDGFDLDFVLDAKFTSLFIQWNPQAVKIMTGLLSKLSNSLAGEGGSTSEPRTLILSPSGAESSRNSGAGWTPRRGREVPTAAKRNRSLGVINAEMDTLEVSLRSARDDLPLFIQTVSNAKIALLSETEGESSNRVASLVLGDVRMTTPNMGRTQSIYRTLLGLAPGQSDSLMCVQYCNGSKAIKASKLEDIDEAKCDTCVDIEISPMRFVYIQAQVLALVEYATEGILGAITAQAASSAAAAAMEIATSEGGDKFFRVKSIGLEVLVPQAAYRPEYLAIQSGSLDVMYHAFNTPPGGSEASLSLSSVFLRDSSGTNMQNKPIGMKVEVALPPLEIGTMDEQAMRVDFEVSEAAFVLLKPQYDQIMAMIGENIGEIDLCLRDHSEKIIGITSRTGVTSEETSEEEVSPTALTHAGVTAIYIPRRMYVNFAIGVLSLELFGKEQGEPLLCVAGVDAHISYSSIPDENRSRSEITLRQLICEDRRLKSFSREYRTLIDAVTSGGEEGDGSADGIEDFFSVSYENNSKSFETKLDLTFGSPRLVFIPDAISEVASFFSRANNPDASTSPNYVEVLGRATPAHQVSAISAVDLDEENEAIEAMFHSSGLVQDPVQMASMVLSLKTSRCSVVLVDVGSENAAVASSSTGQATETIVLRGMFDCSASVASNMDSGRMVTTEAKLQGDAMEVYTAFGRELRSPLQILDPAEFSAVLAIQPGHSGGTEVDVRAAALSPVDLTISMQNIALLNAIVTGISESFSGDEEHEDQDHRHLSQAELSRINKLANDLDAADVSATSFTMKEVTSVAEYASVSDADSSSPPSATVLSVKLTMAEAMTTFINDLQGLDEALFQVTVRNFVASGVLKREERSDDTQSAPTEFDLNVNTSVLADYFDSNFNFWRALLKKPWEMTFRGCRGPAKRFRSKRMNTTLDLESFPCYVSFSEQFLASLGGAMNMWSMYSVATASPLADGQQDHYRRREVESAARNMVTSLPYAVENHAGIDIMFLPTGNREIKRLCQQGTKQYFRFEPPRGNGYGGKRLYGQRVSQKKSVKLFIGDSSIDIERIDTEVQRGLRAHDLENGLVVFTNAVKEGKTTVLHLMNYLDIHNHTSIPFELSLQRNSQFSAVGVCFSNKSDRGLGTASARSSLVSKEGLFFKKSRRFCVAVDCFEGFAKDWSSDGRGTLSLLITPRPHDSVRTRSLSGRMDLHLCRMELQLSEGKKKDHRCDVTCRPFAEEEDQREDPFVVHAHVEAILIGDKHPFVVVTLEPRAVIESKIPVPITLRTPMPHTFSLLSQPTGSNETIHELQEGSRVEVFTPGPSIAVTTKCADEPIAGTPLGWMDGGWIDLPLVPEFRLPEPLRCLFPLKRTDPASGGDTGGIDFMIAQGSESLSELSFEMPQESQKKIGELQATSEPSLGIEVQNNLLNQFSEDLRTFFFTVCDFAVDHTGDLLFEQVPRKSKARGSLRRSTKGPSGRSNSIGNAPRPYAAFASQHHLRRLTLLPDPETPLRLLCLTMEGDDGIKRSSPFRVEDLSISEGGADATPIFWEGSTTAAYYAYRMLVNSHQSEVHVIPEFILFNGSESYSVLVRQPGCPEVVVDAGKVAPIWVGSRERGLAISIEYVELGGRTPSLKVDQLGLRVAVVLSGSGYPVGSLAVQTVIGARDSRLVVKLGELNRGTFPGTSDDPVQSTSIFRDDFLRFRIRWTELELTLNEARPVDPLDVRNTTLLEAALEYMDEPSPSKEAARAFIERKERNQQGGYQAAQLEDSSQRALCTILLHRFTVDWQRVFKEDHTQRASSDRDLFASPERSQFSVIVHNLTLKDETPGSPFPVVFSSTSQNSFFDLCVRIRGSGDSGLVKVQLVDLNLAYSKGKSQKITLNTSEDFLWKLIDLAERIRVSAGELSGGSMQVVWDEKQESYIVSVVGVDSSHQDPTERYKPPKSDILLDIAKVRVSPFTIVATFRRNPQGSRYKVLKKAKGANLMNYFTHRLKFKIEQAELFFSRYEASDVKGPPDRVIEILSTVYVSRIKFKLLTIMSASSFQDWKYLAARDTGDDEFVEGDILRVTGNLAGNTAGYVFNKVGKGLGRGVNKITTTLGDGIENASGKVGAQRLGTGVNSVVSGIGAGVSDTITGVGSGAGKVFKGAGQGIGHVLGGVTGGALLVTKGIGKGVTTGDGKAVVSGLAQGASSVGAGVGHGVETAVMGVSDGVLSVGQGLMSGVKSVGRGLGGAFGGKKADKKSGDQR